jgi:glycosyltransferase involved in cell wall biosynthesis
VNLFEYNTDCFGGTEYMARGAHRFLGGLGKFSRFSCFVIPGRAPQPEDFDGTPLIFWMHNPLDQLSTEVHDLFRNHRIVESIAYIIVPSQWLKERLLHQMDVIHIDPAKFIVIPNATDPIPSDLSRFAKKVDKPILIHASRQERGMEVLIPAAHQIEEDFELRIFNDFYPDTAGIDEGIKDVVLDPRFTFYGDTPRATVMKHMGEAHIHAYPAYWEETSCMVQIEALTSGLLTVTSDVAALPETSMGYSMSVPFSDPKRRDDGGREEDIANFSYSLAEAIRIVQSGLWIPNEQVRETSDYFSWEQAEKRWTEFHDSIP